MWADGVCGTVAEDWRCGAAGPGAVAAEDVEHGVRAHMGEIDDHSETIHLSDEVATCRAHAAPIRRGFGDVAAMAFG